MTTQGEGVIYTVDPFKRDIILEDGRTVHLLDIILGNYKNVGSGPLSPSQKPGKSHKKKPGKNSKRQKTTSPC